MRPHYSTVIDELNLNTALAMFEPAVIGTPPLNIDIETSDIDIACTAQRLNDFVAAVSTVYSCHDNFFAEYFDVLEQRSARCVFTFKDWPIELFCQSLPIAEQWGVRHFNVEQQLLQLDSELKTPFIRDQVMQLKRSGLNTEAAFSTVLGLDGDPFEAILTLENNSSDELRQLIGKAAQTVS